MHVGNRTQELHHKGFHFSEQERSLHRFHKTFEIVLDVVHNDINFIHITSDHDFLEYVEKNSISTARPIVLLQLCSTRTAAAPEHEDDRDMKHEFPFY